LQGCRAWAAYAGMAGFDVEKCYFRGDVVVHAWYREDRVAD
jgi:hypothetical protein